MPKQIRTPLIPSSNGVPQGDGAISRNIAQAFFEPGDANASNGAPLADARSAQVMDDAQLVTRRRSLVESAAAVNADPETLRDMARVPEETLPSSGPDDVAPRREDPWRTDPDITFVSDGYARDDARLKLTNRSPSGIEPISPPPQITDQQKAAIDLILCGKKLKTIAELLGIHSGTLWRWRRYDLDFRRALALASQTALMHSVEQLRALIPKAIDIVHSEVDKENFQAAIQLLRLVRRDLEPYNDLAS